MNYTLEDAKRTDIFTISYTMEFLDDEIKSNPEKLLDSITNRSGYWYVSKNIIVSIMNTLNLVSVNICESNKHDGYYMNGTYHAYPKFQTYIDRVKEMFSTNTVEFIDCDEYDELTLLFKDDKRKCYWGIYWELSWHAAIVRLDYEFANDDIAKELVAIKPNSTNIADVYSCHSIDIDENISYIFTK